MTLPVGCEGFRRGIEAVHILQQDRVAPVGRQRLPGRVALREIEIEIIERRQDGVVTHTGGLDGTVYADPRHDHGSFGQSAFHHLVPAYHLAAPLLKTVGGLGHEPCLKFLLGRTLGVGAQP